MKMIKILLLGVTTLSFTSGSVQANTSFNPRFERIKTQAAAGDKRSQYKLALAYLRGNDIKSDVNEAIYWFEKSARQGYIKAAHKLGMIYYFSKNSSTRYKQAFYWFAQAAKNNHAESQYYLGKLYAEGRGVRRNYDRSLMWLKKAQGLDFLAATREINQIRPLIKKLGRSTRVTVVKPTLTKPTLVTPATNITPTVATSTTRTLGVGGPLKPSPRIVTPVEQPTATVVKTFKTSEILLSGLWHKNGKPAENMPSSLNKCTFSQGMMTCMSKRLNKETDVAQVSYKVQSRFINFKPDGTFDIKYRKNFIFVLPLDADDPNPNVKIPVTGWQRGIKKMKCRIVSKSQIACKESNGSVVIKFHK